MNDYTPQPQYVGSFKTQALLTALDPAWTEAPQVGQVLPGMDVPLDAEAAAYVERIMIARGQILAFNKIARR